MLTSGSIAATAALNALLHRAPAFSTDINSMGPTNSVRLLPPKDSYHDFVSPLACVSRTPEVSASYAILTERNFFEARSISSSVR